MSWKEVSALQLRIEFVSLARQEGANIKELCGRYSISRTTGYKWLKRFEKEGAAGLTDQSRRPCRPLEKPRPSLKNRFWT